jgi:hypothetical protein
MKVLHLSHHYGCLKDHQYIAKELGLDLTSVFTHWDTVIPKGCFRMTLDLANTIWENNAEYFNEFDYVITSDTAPISRIFLENFDKFDGTLIVWVCNRFDYNMEGDMSYYNLFRKYVDHPRVKVVPYTEFENIWMTRFGIKTKYSTIKPIGLTIPDPLSEDESHIIGFDGNYELDLSGGDVLVSRYHNDNKFQNSRKICEGFGLKTGTATYRGAEELKKISDLYECFLIFPDAYSKFTTFELMQIGMPIILPSEELLLDLSRKPNYFFSTGIYPQTVKYCEWYNEHYENFAVYFEEMDGIGEAVSMVRENRTVILQKMSDCAIIHKEHELNKWREIYV